MNDRHCGCIPTTDEIRRLDVCILRVVFARHLVRRVDITQSVWPRSKNTLQHYYIT